MSQTHTNEFHEFTVDQGLAHHLIYSQNGTISTALCELVTNAIDAGSDSVKIIITPNSFDIYDNGEGFKDEETIMAFFKRFGTPHTEGDAKYGRFRIGRGQIMGFAKTTWHSNTFTMEADAKTPKAGFHFSRDAEYRAGCHVFGQFYTKLKSYELSNAERSIAEAVRFSSCPVYINGELVSVSREAKWDYEDELIRVSFDTRGRYGIKVYSQGVFVKDLRMELYGFSADIDTKNALILNMARNEVNDTDPVWIHINKVLRAELKRRQSKSNKLDEMQRRAHIDQFLSGHSSFTDINNLRLIKDARGKSQPLWKLLLSDKAWTLAKRNQEKLADTIAGIRGIFTIKQEELDLWGVENLEDLFNSISDRILQDCKDKRLTSPHSSNVTDNGYYISFARKVLNIQIIDFEQLSKEVSTESSIINNTELSKKERAQKNALQYMANNIGKSLSKLHDEKLSSRQICIGESYSSVAWTDSMSFIAINRDYLSLFDSGYEGLTQLALIIIHEYTHKSGSLSTNDHDVDFYELFHDSVLTAKSSTDILGKAVKQLESRYLVQLEAANLRYPKWYTGPSSELKITLSTTKPTPLFKWFFNILDIPYKIVKGDVIAQVSRSKLHDMYSKNQVDSAINRELKSNGIPLPDTSKYNHLNNHKDIEKWHQNIIDDRVGVIRQLLDKKNIIGTDYAVEQLAHYCHYREEGSKYEHSYLSSLAYLTGDSSFGVLAFELPFQVSTNIIGCKVDLKQYKYHNSLSARELNSDNSAARLNNAKREIEAIFKTILDPHEREELADRMLSEEMKKILMGR